MMQERQNEDFTDPAKPKDTDISSTSTSESSVHNNDSNSDNDDDISESEDSLQEEAVLPESDRINSLILEIDRINLPCPRQYGYTKIYEVEEGLNGNVGTKIAIPKVSLYLEKGNALEHLNMIEYECLMQKEKKRPKRMTETRTRQEGNRLCEPGDTTRLPATTGCQTICGIRHW